MITRLPLPKSGTDKDNTTTKYNHKNESDDQDDNIATIHVGYAISMKAILDGMATSWFKAFHSAFFGRLIF